VKIIPAGLPSSPGKASRNPAAGKTSRKPAARRLPKKAIDQIIARRNTEVVTECGCVLLPEPLVELLGEKKSSVLCPDHGWQYVIRAAKLREIWGMPEPGPLPEDPPF
jgi:hypothetical protein